MMPEQDNVYLSAKPCDSCKASPAILFCRSHSVFLCASCDANINASSTDKHERVWLCEVCEQSPADVTCKADSAALCSSCDLHIHSANALASRHERLPVLPFFGTDFLPSDYCSFLDFVSPVHFSDLKHETKSINYLDSAVPSQTNSINCSGRESCFEIEFSHSNSSQLNYSSQCISQSVSSSEAGAVPDGSSNSISEVSNFPFLNSWSAQPLQISGIERKARVMRYREKKKNRKFQKTIRYASRKAYAERRARIKGRFTKRIEEEGEVSQAH